MYSKLQAFCMLAAAALQSFNPNFLVSNATLQHLVNDFSQFLLILWYKLCIDSVFSLFIGVLILENFWIPPHCCLSVIIWGHTVSNGIFECLPARYWFIPLRDVLSIIVGSLIFRGGKQAIPMSPEVPESIEYYTEELLYKCRWTGYWRRVRPKDQVRTCIII